MPPEMGAPNAYSCGCVCTGTGQQIALNLTACYPADLNPVLTPGLDQNFQPTGTQLDTDCSNRVGQNLTQLTKACVTSSINCLCDAVPSSSVFATECNVPCQQEVLAPGCTNFDPLAQPPVKTATNVVGKPPVCLAASSDPPNPLPDPLAAAAFGRSSQCEVTGDVTISDDDGHSQTRGANGVVHFAGGPCPDWGCQIGMSYRLDHVANFDFDGFLGFGGVRIEDIFALGASLPGAATLDASGKGTFEARTTQSSGRGKQVDEGILSDDVSRKSYVGTNSGPLDVQVLWDARVCRIKGSVLGSVDAGHGAAISVDLTGTLVNQPPTANAGGNKTVECTSQAGASVQLDGSGSTDPDNNIAQYVWRRGTRFGDEVGTDSQIAVNLAVGASQTYFLRTIDAYGQASEASVVVKVVDTTPPVITSVSATPNILSPRNHKMIPVRIDSTASDRCGATTCWISAVTANEPINARGDGSTTLDWQLTGNLTVDLRAERSGNLNDRIYTLTVTCSDPSGNKASKTTAVTVPHN